MSQIDQPSRDDRLARAVETRLQACHYWHLRSITCDSSEGIVTIRGQVPSFCVRIQAGEASILDDVAAAHRQMAELEARLAETDAKKIAVVQSQKKLLQSVREIAEQRYRAGSASQGDVLSLDLELSKLDLWLLELKGE